MRLQTCGERQHASVHALIKRGLSGSGLHDAVSQARVVDHLVYEFCTLSGEAVTGYIAACPMTLEPAVPTATPTAQQRAAEAGPESAASAAIAASAALEPPSALGLVPLVVAPEYHGQGLGSALVQHLITTAAHDGWEAIFVLGKPTFYARFGFEPSHISNGFGAVRSFQQLELSPGCLKNLRARALYPGPFPNQRTPSA